MIVTSIPDFNPDGLLPAGIWECNGDEFIERFCRGDHRTEFAYSIRNIFDFSTARGAHHVLIGGSFVSRKSAPNDLDCVIIFEHENQIPDRTERLDVDGTRLDVFFCAKTQTDILASFRIMLSHTRSEREVGVVQVNLREASGQVLWDALGQPESATLDIVKRAYFNRHVVNRNHGRKALVTVHGIRSSGDWNAEVSLIASSNGWIVAPFHYGYVEATVFLDPGKRKSIVDKFREHIFYIKDRYKCDISVIAHSYGTYVACKYLFGFDRPPVPIDTLVLTGSIINENLDVDSFQGRAFKVINEVAPNDPIVKYARAASLWDELVGRSGETGFKKASSRLIQNTCDIFDHTNVIRRDVIAQRWMPALEVNVGKGRQEALATTSLGNARFI